jgi:hypothetical protein
VLIALNVLIKGNFEVRFLFYALGEFHWLCGITLTAVDAVVFGGGVVVGGEGVLLLLLLLVVAILVRFFLVFLLLSLVFWLMAA